MSRGRSRAVATDVENGFIRKGPKDPSAGNGAADTHGLFHVNTHPEQTQKPLLVRYSEWIEEPVHSSTIAIFRMLYALCILAQLSKWSDMFEEFNTSYTVFPYPMMSWVRPLSPENGHYLLGTCASLAVLQFIGLATPIATAGVFVTFSWLFLICESNHNNHYLLMCHLTFCGSFIGWGKWMSIDQLLRAKLGRHPDPRVPRWSLLVVRLIFCIPYFYGAIAKMNHDWLFRAQPVTMWFAHRGGILSHPLFPWFICWSGCAFDLTISFLLWWRPTRYLIGFPASLCFNVSNKIMFNIGVFPMMMVASLTLFLEPHHPAQLLAFILRRQVYGVPSTRADSKSKRDEDDEKHRLKASSTVGSNIGNSNGGSSSGAGLLEKQYGLLTLRQWWGVIFFTVFCLFHALNPLREKVLYPSNSSWTEEGHFGAWHMKLRTKRGATIFELEEQNGAKHYLNPEDDRFVNPMQVRKVGHKPHMTILHVARLKMLFDAASRPLKSVKARSCWALNGRSPHQLFIPEANLLDYIGKYEWLGVTGVDKFLYRDEEGPSCKRKDLERKYSSETAEAALREVRAQAGIIVSRASGLKRIKRRVSEGVYEDAYLWPMFE